MNLNEAVQRAIVSKWTLPEKLAFTQAPSNAQFPYGVFFLDSTWNGYFHAFNLQFNLFDDDRSSEGINDFAEAVKTAFQDSALTVTGHKTVGVIRKTTESIFTSDSGHWQCTLVFNFIVN